MPTATSKKRPAKWLLILTAAYGGALAALTEINLGGADRFWLGALNLYLPQIVWAVPGILLTLFLLRRAARWVWAPLLCLLWALGPVMGFCWGTQMSGEPASATAPLRIMSWNVKYGGYNWITQLVIADEIGEARPDVVLLQDAEGLLHGPIGGLFEGWNVASSGQYIVASRFPIEESGTRGIPFAEEDATCLRVRLRAGEKTLVLYDVHFESPRWGLNAFREVQRQPWYLPRAIQGLRQTVDARLSQAATLSALVRQEREPVIIAGDLNSPDASLACTMLREAGLHDAFAEAGRGYGYTYGHLLLRHRLAWLKASWMRIDHIMLSSVIRSYTCRVGGKIASEHRPVIADVLLESKKTNP